MIIRFLLLLTLCFSAYADSILIVHQNYAGVNTNVGNRLIAAGHTVTYTTTDPTNLSGYQQVWDLRYSVAVSGNLATLYNNFLQASGFLYLTTENPGCCATRNNSVATFISNAGGGATTIGGSAGSTSNTLNVMNTNYMTAGITITFAAGSNIQNSQGTWLFKDSAGKVGGMLWIGNAGDLGSGYNGTILVVSDINWTDNTFFTANNLIALDDMIDGFVAATVQGTISESGNSGGAATPVYSSGITVLQQSRKTARLGANPGGHNTSAVVNGNDNEVTIQQIGPSGHYLLLNIDGSTNTTDILQTSTVSGQRHYLESVLIGSNNSLTLQQRDTSKTAFVSVTGDHNTINMNQKGTGTHYLDLSITGNYHTAGIIQDGAGNHAATVALSGTQPWNFTLHQNSSAAQTYSLPYAQSDGSTVSGSCSAIGGCNLTVNQQ